MKAILTDVTKCIGCRECVKACKKRNNLDQDFPRRWVSNDGLSALNWTSVIQQKNTFIRKQCRHCLEPACASVCPVAALRKTETGAVIYDSKRCLGCRYCMMACPYGIPRYDWASRVPTVKKCILCYEQIKNGGTPACASACPTGATIFGERNQLLNAAHKQIESVPDQYINRVWGEKEIGGTCVLYISNVNIDVLSKGIKLGEKALPALTAPAMKAVPYTFVGMGVFLTGLHWIIKRRMKLEGESGSEGGDHE